MKTHEGKSACEDLMYTSSVVGGVEPVGGAEPTGGPLLFAGLEAAAVGRHWVKESSLGVPVRSAILVPRVLLVKRQTQGLTFLLPFPWVTVILWSKLYDIPRRQKVSYLSLPPHCMGMLAWLVQLCGKALTAKVRDEISTVTDYLVSWKIPVHKDNTAY